MKRITNYVFVLFLLVSCSTKKPTILGLDLEQGKSYQQTLTSQANITQTINGQTMTIAVTVTGSMSYLVKEIRQSSYLLHVKYTRLKMFMKTPMGKVKFDSENKDTKDVFAKMMGTMKGKSFVVEMLKNGKVKQVKKLDLLFKGIFEQFPELTEGQKKQIKAQLEKAFGEKAFRGNIEMVTAIFPDAAVNIGDQWLIKTKLESNMSAGVDTKFELKESSDTYHKIQGKSTIKTSNEAAYTEQNGMPMKLNMTGTMSSDITVDKKTGWIIKATIQQHLKGHAQIKENELIPNDMKIPMVMKSSFTISNK